MRDEEKIAVIFDMMKRKCVKTDSDKVTGLTPNIVTVSQNSLPVSVSYLLWVVVLRDGKLVEYRVCQIADKF